MAKEYVFSFKEFHTAEEVDSMLNELRSTQ